MPDPSYVVETQGRKAGLQFHLNSAFYPPLPMYVKVAFLHAFEEYWDGKLNIYQLSEALEERAGYVGDLGQYNFWQFLNEEDLH